MTYSIDSDILGRISHIKVPTGVLVSTHRNAAHTEINIQIRKLYEVPVASTDQTDMDFLRDIEADLAGGKLIMDVASVKHIDELDAFGKELIERASINLSKILAEKIVLIGAAKDADPTDDMVNFPEIRLSSPDRHDTFNRPMSGIEQDMVDGRTNTKAYNRLNDTFKDD